jgi:hypothetical protein
MTKYLCLTVWMLAILPAWVRAQDLDSAQQAAQQVKLAAQEAKIEAQLDSLQSFLNQKKVKPPTQAALYSAIIPGLGQWYNRKAWYIEIPIIYGVTGFLVWNTARNHREFVTYRNAYLYRLDNNPATEPPAPYNDARRFTNDGLRARRDQFRRDRDYMVIVTAAFYLLQVVEAAAVAHLKTFDDSDDLSWRIVPAILPTSGNTLAYGVTLRLTIK